MRQWSLAVHVPISGPVDVQLWPYGQSLPFMPRQPSMQAAALGSVEHTLPLLALPQSESSLQDGTQRHDSEHLPLRQLVLPVHAAPSALPHRPSVPQTSPTHSPSFVHVAPAGAPQMHPVVTSP